MWDHDADLGSDVSTTTPLADGLPRDAGASIPSTIVHRRRSPMRAFPGHDRTEPGDTLCGVARPHDQRGRVRGAAPDHLGLVSSGGRATPVRSAERGPAHRASRDAHRTGACLHTRMGSDSPRPSWSRPARRPPSIVSCSITFPEDGSRGGHLVVLLGERQSASGAPNCVRSLDPVPRRATHRSVESHAVLVQLGLGAGCRPRREPTMKPSAGLARPSASLRLSA